METGEDNRTFNCEASRSLKWFISNAGVMNPVYKVSLPNPRIDGDDLPLFQVSKPSELAYKAIEKLLNRSKIHMQTFGLCFTLHMQDIKYHQKDLK